MSIDSVDSDDATHPGIAGRIPMVAAARVFRRQLFLAQSSRDALSSLLAKNEASHAAVERLVAEVSLRWGAAKSALITIGELAVDQHGSAVFEQAKYALRKSADTLNAVLRRTLLWANDTPLHQVVRQILDGNSQDGEPLPATHLNPDGTTDAGTNAR